MADASGSPGPSFGPRLARRVRPRAHVARRITDASRIGIVARSSAGFGLAIGMSQGSRPAVTPDTFTSTRLRPPVPVWRRHEAQPETPAPTASWTEQIVGAQRPRRSSSVTPTYAQRSRANSAVAPTASDGDFVSSGDRKLDALRRMLATSPDGKPAPQRDNPQRTEGSTDRQRISSERPEVDDAAPSVPDKQPVGRRGDTASGPGTAPGEIGRRFRPEPAALDTDKAILPAEAASSADGTGQVRSNRTRRTAGGGSKDMDSFRRMLQQRGFIPPTDGDDGGDTSPRPTADDTIRRTPKRPRPGSDNGTPTRPTPPTERTSQATQTAQTRPAQTRPVQTRPPGAESPAGDPPSAAAAPSPSAEVATVRAGNPSGVFGAGTTPDGKPSATLPASDGPQPMVGELMQRRINRMLPNDGVSIADTPGPDTTAGSLDAAEHTEQQPFGAPSIGRPDIDATAVVAPPFGGTTQSTTATATATTATVQRSIESTRIGQTRSAPGAALALLADRAGLPHTQSDHRRPASTLARSLAPSEQARVADASRLGTVARPDTPGTSSARLRPAAAVVEQAKDRTAQRTSDTERRSEQQHIGTPATDVTDGPHAPAATPVIAAPTQSPDTPTDAATRSIVAPSPQTTQVAASHRLDTRLLARPGRLGRIAGDEQLPTGLQRHSVVRPGPGALQRALADTSEPAQVQPALVIERAPDDTPRAAPSQGDRIDISGPAAAPAHQAVTPRPPASRPAEPTRNAAAGRPTRDPGDQRIARQSTTPTATEPTGHVLRRSSDDSASRTPAAGPEAVESVAPPAASLGDRFLHELSRRPAPKATPLPEQYRPIAQAITGHHKVMLSVDDNSRRALRSVDKVAATTDNVIHLDKPLTPGRRTTELLAHELTHVANPSPAPRFFDDDVRSPEERQAEQVAKVMARAPLAPSGAVSRSRGAPATPASRTSSGSETIRRTAATPQGTLNAAALAASITGSGQAPASTDQVVRRSTASPTASASRATGETIRRDIAVSESQSTDFAAATDDFGSMSDAEFRDLVDRNFEYMLRRLEQRMIVELERRGGRFWRGV